MGILDEREDNNQETHNAFFAEVEKPIESGLVLALQECERLWNEDREKYQILHDWLVDKLGGVVHAARISFCYHDDDKGEFYFKVPEEFLDTIENTN